MDKEWNQFASSSLTFQGDISHAGREEVVVGSPLPPDDSRGPSHVTPGNARLVTGQSSCEILTEAKLNSSPFFCPADGDQFLSLI